MLTKWFYILVLGISILPACKKDNTWSPEDGLSQDTVNAIFKTEVISQTPSEIIIQVDFVRLNGTKSETDYSNDTCKTKNSQYVDSEFINATVINQPINNQFSTLLVVEPIEIRWFSENRINFGLRRLFELYDNNSDNKIGFVSYKMDSISEMDFLIENSSTFYNSSDFNNKAFLQILKDNLTDNSAHTSAELFKNQMYRAMDSLILCADCYGQKSITFLDDSENGSFSFLENMYIDSIIKKAIDNTININLITNSINGEDYSRMAIETGGFIFSSRENHFSPTTEEPHHIPSMLSAGLLVQNLNLFLTGNLTTHRIRLKLIKGDGGFFSSGEYFGTTINYNKQEFYLSFKVP